MKASIKTRMARSISLSQKEIFLRADFRQLGSESRITRSLQALIAEGKLVRLGYGVYSKSMPSPISGKAIPRKPLESLAVEALKALNVEFDLGSAQRDYFEGKTTQIPMKVIIRIGDKGFSRKISLGEREVIYEKNLARAK